ncbi:hypothetical protein FACS1894199_12830 [Bacteroidia bacterium]|nr:hypothetical protein FACS1894199_12830 [Bacteroidia bacterium]
MCSVVYNLLKEDESLIEHFKQSSPFSLNITIDKSNTREDIIQQMHSFSAKYKRSSVQFFGIRVNINPLTKKIGISIKCRSNFAHKFSNLQEAINNEINVTLPQ